MQTPFPISLLRKASTSGAMRKHLQPWALPRGVPITDGASAERSGVSRGVQDSGLSALTACCLANVFGKSSFVPRFSRHYMEMRIVFKAVGRLCGD